MATFLVLAAAIVAASLHGLVAPLRQTAVGRTHDRSRRATNIGLAVFVAVVAAALYAGLGNPDALTPPAPDPVTAMAQERTATLASRLARQGDDVPGLRLLARSLDQLHRYPEAAAARARLVALLPDDPEALDDLAEALSTTQGGTYVGEPIAAVRRALALDPANDRALAMAANEAAQRDDLSAAIDYWTRMASRAPSDSALGRSLRENIDRARAALVEAAPPVATRAP